jgi:ubiquitin-conjugating enzyme E2 J2
MSQLHRIITEVELILCDPIPNVSLWIDPNNLKIWHFIISGLAGLNSPYTNGEYVCRLKISEKYPYEVPVFTMETPNGRFAPGQPLCINDFASRPEKWKTDWTLDSLIRAFISYFQSICHRGENVGNNIIAVKAEKLALAQNSKQYNLTHHQSLLDKIKTKEEITIIG